MSRKKRYKGKQQQTQLQKVEPTPPPQPEEQGSGGFSLFRRPQSDIQQAGGQDAVDRYAEAKELELRELRVTERRKTRRIILDEPIIEQEPPPKGFWGRVKRFFRNLLAYLAIGLIVAIPIYALENGTDNPWMQAAGINMTYGLICLGPFIMGGLVLEKWGKYSRTGTREDVSVTVRRKYTKKRGRK